FLNQLRVQRDGERQFIAALIVGTLEDLAMSKNQYSRYRQLGASCNKIAKSACLVLRPVEVIASLSR
ncbi:MAG: hypothetical protein ACK8QZ_07245, partial [Anaerolineales bacterium]